MIFIDSNIFLRYFEKEDEQSFKKSERFFSKIVSGNIKGISTSLVIAEVVWVLQKFYNWNRKEICSNIELILKTPNIKFKERSVLSRAISIYRDINIDFIDAYNYSYMKNSEITEIYSFDRDFNRFSDIKRLEP